MLFIKYIYATQWSNDVPIVEETDCVPACSNGGVCYYNNKIGKTNCACPEGYHHHPKAGCQRAYNSRVTCDAKTSETYKVQLGRTYEVICPCKSGYHKGVSQAQCIKNTGCEGVKCPAYTKCKTLTNGKWECEPDGEFYLNSEDKLPFPIGLCKENNEDKVCIPPAACTTALNKNGPQSTVCSCPDDMYLTKDKRQCARLETFPPNHVYTVKLAEDTKVFPNKFDIYLEGCFNVHINRDKSRLIYQSRDTLGDLDVNVEIPTSIKSMHFKMTNTTLNIFANDNTKMHPLFTTHFRNVNCKFLPNAHLLEENSNVLIKTATRMDPQIPQNSEAMSS